MIRKQAPLLNSRRRATVALLVAISLVALAAVAALALDAGVLQDDRRRLQGAADAAALAAADDLYQHYGTANGLDPNSTAAASARASASANGYADGTAATVTVNIPPTSGHFVGKAGYAEVIIAYNQPRYFSSAFGSGTLPVKARAVARGTWAAVADGIIVLDPKAPSALNAHGNGNLYVSGAPVIVNSSDSNAATAQGNGLLEAPNFYVTGNYTTNGNAQFVGTMTTASRPVPDPLRYLPAPDPSTLPTGNSSTSSSSGGTSGSGSSGNGNGKKASVREMFFNNGHGNGSSSSSSSGSSSSSSSSGTSSSGSTGTTSSGSSTSSSGSSGTGSSGSSSSSSSGSSSSSTGSTSSSGSTGSSSSTSGSSSSSSSSSSGSSSTSSSGGGSGTTYYLTPGVFSGGLKFSGQDSVVMAPGIYYMDGGGFSFSGQGSLTGSGVMIYNAPSGSSDNISITGKGNVSLTPPTSGPYTGLLLFQDRTSNADMKVTGNGSFDITGTFYAAGANVKIEGNGDVSVGSQYISNQLDIGGNGSLNITYNAKQVARTRSIGLVE
jgi:hypothetical protein